MTNNPTALTLGDALQVDEARRACQLIAQQRRAARLELERAENDLAEKERLYRKARAVAYVANAAAPSAGARDALVDEESADARYDRDVARGVMHACEERLKEIDAERASLHRLISWSQDLQAQLEPAEPGSVRAIRGVR